MGDRCSGHCCRRFYLPFDYEFLLELWRVQRWHKSLLGRFITWIVPKNPEVYAKSIWSRPALRAVLNVVGLIPLRFPAIPEEIATIAAMVIPLGAFTHSSNGDRLPEEEWTKGWAYTCKHFNIYTNNCGIYERRPAMCRDYPYGERCTFSGCTWDAAQNLKEEADDLQGEEVRSDAGEGTLDAGQVSGGRSDGAGDSGSHLVVLRRRSEGSSSSGEGESRQA